MNSLIFLFEVMGEFPTAAQLWGIFLLIGIGGFLLVRLHPAFLLLILPLALLISAGQFIDIYSDLYPHVVREAGHSYIMQSYLTAFGSIFFPCLGVVAWFKRRKTVIQRYNLS